MYSLDTGTINDKLSKGQCFCLGISKSINLAELNY